MAVTDGFVIGARVTLARSDKQADRMAASIELGAYRRSARRAGLLHRQPAPLVVDQDDGSVSMIDAPPLMAEDARAIRAKYALGDPKWVRPQVTESDVLPI